MAGRGKIGKKKQNTTYKEYSKNIPHEKDSDSTNMHKAFSLPHIKIADNCNLLPKYSFILKGSHTSDVLMQDLDVLQIELELLLTTVAHRNHILIRECQYLNSIDAGDREDIKVVVGKDEKSIEGDANASSNGTPLKRAKTFEKVCKNIKESQSDVFKKPLPVICKKTTRQLSMQKSKQENVMSGSDDSTPVPKAKPKRYNKLRPSTGRYGTYDNSSKFWNSIHSICHDYQEADLKTLRELIKTQEEVNVLPQLGKLFAKGWAESEITEEKNAGTLMTVKKRSRNYRFLSTTTSVLNILKKAEDTCKELSAVPSPLCKRLFSSFKKRKIIKRRNNKIPSVKNNEIGQMHRGTVLLTSINEKFRNVSAGDLESRLRKDLCCLGVLSGDVPIENSGDGDLVEEIQRAERELSAVSSIVITDLKYMLLLTQHEMKRQELSRKIRMLDEDIDKAYHSIMIQKARYTDTDQPLSDKVREQAVKLLKQRESLISRQAVLNVEALKLKRTTDDTITLANTNCPT